MNLAPADRLVAAGVYGVIHLPALPGDPGDTTGTGDFSSALDHGLADAEALVRGGVVGLVVENFGSAPFAKGTPGDRIPPHQAAALTVLAQRCRERFDVAVGVNCLRNDGPAAIGIAAATGSAFVRINVHVGAYVTDQGLIEGEAATTLRYRAALGAHNVAIWADVLVKHAVPLAPVSLQSATGDCVARGLADAVIVTGAATGGPVDAGDLDQVAAAAGNAPVVIGSGLTPETAIQLAPRANAAIVGSYFKRGGQLRAPVDPQRVRRLVDAATPRFATAAR